MPSRARETRASQAVVLQGFSASGAIAAMRALPRGIRMLEGVQPISVPAAVPRVLLSLNRPVTRCRGSTAEASSCAASSWRRTPYPTRRISEEDEPPRCPPPGTSRQAKRVRGAKPRRVGKARAGDVAGAEDGRKRGDLVLVGALSGFPVKRSTLAGATTLSRGIRCAATRTRNAATYYSSRRTNARAGPCMSLDARPRAKPSHLRAAAHCPRGPAA